MTWCGLQGRYATDEECATGCAAPEQRPVCLMERDPKMTTTATTCRHAAYADGHCAEMGCPNYFSRCPRHAASGGRPDQPCSQDRASARETHVEPVATPKRSTGPEALRRLEQRLIPYRTTAGEVEAWETYRDDMLPRDLNDIQIRQGFSAGYDAAMSRIRTLLADEQTRVLRETRS